MITLRKTIFRATALMLGCTLAASAFANPTGMDVIAGKVSATTSGNSLLISNSPGSIINWQSFSIMPGELTQFIQEGASSSVLNRITGQNPSQVLGALRSNGKVLLINPNGIVFGAGAQINVNGLVASSLDMSNADFLAGKLKFSGAATAGNVTNSGGITTPSGGQVYLIAPNVTNNGIITSPSGDVMLAAGHSVDLADSSDPDIRVVVSAPADQALNVGKVIADSGKVGVYGALVTQSGLISANTALRGANGKIVLKATDTTTLGAGSVTTASGGEIQSLGNRVAVTDDAKINVSSQSNGGTVLIGGDTHGDNPSIQNAALTYVGPQTRIDANGGSSGNGGKVVVWSDQQTQLYGSISARGGAQGGSGGFVETSSAGKLDFRGRVDLRAPAGAAGTLLLDPSDVLISSGGTSSDVTLPSTAPFTVSGSNESSVLSATDLQNELALGNVTVTTSSSASAPLGGSITVAAPVQWSNANSLTLQADQNIYLNAPITGASGVLLLNAANGNITQSGGPITAAALSAVAPNGNVDLEDYNNAVGVVAGSSGGMTGFYFINNGSFSVGSVSGVSGITSTGAQVTGVFLQTPDAGNITLDAPVNAAGAQVTIYAAGAVRQGSAGLITANALRVYSNDVGDTGIGTSEAPLLLNVGQLKTAETQTGPIYISNMGDLVVSSVIAPDVVNIQTSGSLTTTTTQSCDCQVGIAGSEIRLSATGLIDIGDQFPITGTNDVALYAGYDPSTHTYAGSNNTINVIGSLSGSTVTLSAGGAINVTGSVTGTLTQTANQYSGGAVTTPPPPPTLAQCTADPALPGCSAVLPTITQCTADPSQAGCSVVLPTLASCVADPAAAGCSAVLPTLASCTANPGLAGCQVVLPTLASCTANPGLAGCQVVLPTLASCTANPGLPGCQVVLPTLASCAANPSQQGCSAVLPTLASCTANPAQSGCQAVLPTLASCAANPSQPGCSVVLPTLTSCTTNPAQSGCQAVLPTLTSCVANPSQSGCLAVLPTVDQCKAAPTLAGCPPPPVTSSSPTAPVQQASNQVVTLINSTVNQSSSSSTSLTASTSTTANSSTSAKDKSDNADQTGGSSTPSGAKQNAATKKLYCN